jgi:hypothetical protein
MRRLAVVLVTLAFLATLGAAGIASASTAHPASALNCSASAWGSPGTQTFTLHTTNSCRFPLRAVTLCEPIGWPYFGLHWAYGPWVYGNRTSPANCGGGTDRQLQWGYDTPTVYRELGHVFGY